MLLIARTDSESGKLLSSNVDVADHEFILGTTRKGCVSLAQALADAEARGATGAEVDGLEQDWTQSHPMCTFNQGQSVLSLEGGWDSESCVKLLRKLSKTRIGSKTSPLRSKLTLLLLMGNLLPQLETSQQISWVNQSSGIVIVSHHWNGSFFFPINVSYSS